MSGFDYAQAFSRNIGWVTPAEQQRLREARVAIAGLGGVGGAHAVTLARLGLSRFHLADLDQFGLQNFNRQAGAFMSTLGRDKLDVIAERVLDVNPEAEIRRFPAGVQAESIDEFLSGVDLYIDGLDFFVLPIRSQVFARCEALGIPAITAAPMGMGTSLLVFHPRGMSFERYFRLQGQPELEQYARFIVGLTPTMIQRHYLTDLDAANFSERRGPSTVMACELCAAVTGTTALKLLLGRGRVRCAPWAMQFDAYLGRLRYTWRPFGNANPLQQAMLRFVRPRLKAMAR